MGEAGRNPAARGGAQDRLGRGGRSDRGAEVAGEDGEGLGFEGGEGAVVFDDVGGEGGFFGDGPLGGDAGQGLVFGEAAG